MIVAYDATTLRGPISGVGYYTARLLDSLANGGGQGIVDRLIVLSNRTLDLTPRPGVEIHAGGRFRLRAVWMQFVLPGILRQLEPDVVHFTNYLAPLATRVPFVVSFHDMSLTRLPECHTFKKRLLTSSLIPLVASRAARILTPSESTRRDVIELLAVDPDRVRVVPYAASPQFRPATEGPERLEAEYGITPPYFLYVGTLEPRKNLVRTLRAFARVAPSLPDHRFVLVGQKGWKYEEILQTAATPALADRVSLLGYVSEEDLPLLYSHATALVYPSLFEGFGLPVVEAMACGTPVITSNGSSLGEIAGGAALLVDPLEESQISDAFVAVATDRPLAAELGRLGSCRAAEFSWERTGRETAAIYREVREERVSGRRTS